MQNIYLDNAATAPVFPEVVERMAENLRENFGNPSSTHQTGRKARTVIETARKQIAGFLNCNSSEIVFTSGGTEANNLIVRGSLKAMKIKRFLTSKLEHPSVLNTIKELEKEFKAEVAYVQHLPSGEINLAHLKSLLQASNKRTLVSLMWVNNETGNILDVKTVGELCKEYNALFHSDTVQAIGHFKTDLTNTPVDFITGSAHKFHGPKGVGFAYIGQKNTIAPILTGGEQEKGLRAGTEDTTGIAGMAKALEITFSDFRSTDAHLRELKRYSIQQLTETVPGVQFNGLSGDMEKSAPHILNIRLPKQVPMLLFKLDMQHIAVSEGSACQSGSSKGSHVLKALLPEEALAKSSFRISFSRFNTKTEIDRFIQVLGDILLKIP